jgi:hypothetical protein
MKEQKDKLVVLFTKLAWHVLSSVANPDPDAWDRIWILTLKNDPKSTFLVCVKAINTIA